MMNNYKCKECGAAAVIVERDSRYFCADCVLLKLKKKGFKIESYAPRSRTFTSSSQTSRPLSRI